MYQLFQKIMFIRKFNIVVAASLWLIFGQGRRLLEQNASKEFEDLGDEISDI